MVDDFQQDIERFIREAFEENFRQLRAETGGGLAPDIKEMALQQVLLYWRKLHEIAARVTDTEVRLNLPGLQTPEGASSASRGLWTLFGRTIAR